MVSKSCPDPFIKLFVKVTEPALAVQRDPAQLGVPAKRMVTLETLWLQHLGPPPLIQGSRDSRSRPCGPGAGLGARHATVNKPVSSAIMEFTF